MGIYDCGNEAKVGDKVIEGVDNTTPLELLEAWLISNYTVIEHGEGDFRELLEVFKSRGISFDD